MATEMIDQWFARMEIAPLVGTVIIAVATVIAANAVRLLGRSIALALSRWSGLGITNQFLEIIQRPLWVSVILAGFLAEVQWIKPPLLVGLVITGVAKSGLTIVWVVVIARGLKLVCSRLLGYYPAGVELFRLAENIGIAVVVGIGALIVLAVWQINLTPLLASAGAVGIIVALAAKDVMGNFFGGITVFLDRPFRTGDYIVLSSGERGKVVDIGLRSTRILSRDDVLISIPNSMISSSKIINESAPSRIMRVRVRISVLQGTDVDKVQEALLKVAEENPLVLAEPRPRVRFRSFGDTSFDFELLCWTANPKDKGRLVHQLNTAAVKEFDRSGITFPTPQREVFIYPMSGVSTLAKGEWPHTAGDDADPEQKDEIPTRPDVKSRSKRLTDGMERLGP